MKKPTDEKKNPSRRREQRRRHLEWIKRRVKVNPELMNVWGLKAED